MRCYARRLRPGWIQDCYEREMKAMETACGTSDLSGGERFSMKMQLLIRDRQDQTSSATVRLRR